MAKYFILLLLILNSCKNEDLTTATEDLPMEMRGVYKLIEAKSNNMNTFDINNDGIESNDILGQMMNSEEDGLINPNINNASLFTIVTPNTLFIKFPRSRIYGVASSKTFSRNVLWRYNAKKYVLYDKIILDLDNLNYNDGYWYNIKYNNSIMSAEYQANFYDFKNKRFTLLNLYVKFKKVSTDIDKEAYKVAKNTPIIYSKDYPKK
ncbi:hypothetical protein K5X82_09180 [Halosquirtibacter xylanolyticus]|uniref:hypothetical protein n=1 Tax=Halosquirtibacter xylanolyticus TaxID=3374599 RepID=UPI003749F6E0|nr:hypothetical protein K5X82_09180 [Prolixibacteraceae bacterium]